jgi:hypothetical protein
MPRSGDVPCQLICVDPIRVPEFWPYVRPLIVRAMQRGGGAFWPVESAVLQGRALLWLAWNGERIEAAAVTELQQSEWRKVCEIVACGGAVLARWIDLIDGIEQYARAEGATAVRIVGRDGWERVLRNYRRKRVVLEKELS